MDGVLVDPVSRTLRAVHTELAALSGGALAHYIPPLAAVDSDRFGIAVAGVAGSLYSAGDTGEFTIQSVSRLMDRTRSGVMAG